MDISRTNVVLVVDKHGRERLENEPDGARLLLNPATAVLALPADQETALAKALDEQSLLVEGAMLLKSPFHRGRFALADRAAEQFAKEKHFLVSAFCGLLGAKDVRVIHVELEEGSVVETLDVSGDRLGTSAGVTGKREQIQNFAASLSLHDQYPGAPPDLEAAGAFLRKHGLASDQNLVSLLEARQGRNPLQSRKLKVTAADESRHVLSVAAKLAVPTFLSIDAEYTKAVKVRREYRLTLSVQF